MIEEFVKPCVDVSNRLDALTLRIVPLLTSKGDRLCVLDLLHQPDHPLILAQWLSPSRQPRSGNWARLKNKFDELDNLDDAVNNARRVWGALIEGEPIGANAFYFWPLLLGIGAMVASEMSSRGNRPISKMCAFVLVIYDTLRRRLQNWKVFCQTYEIDPDRSDDPEKCRNVLSSSKVLPQIKDVQKVVGELEEHLAGAMKQLCPGFDISQPPIHLSYSQVEGLGRGKSLPTWKSLADYRQCVGKLDDGTRCLTILKITTYTKGRKKRAGRPAEYCPSCLEQRVRLQVKERVRKSRGKPGPGE